MIFFVCILYIFLIKYRITQISVNHNIRTQYNFSERKGVGVCSRTCLKKKRDFYAKANTFFSNIFPNRSEKQRHRIIVWYVSGKSNNWKRHVYDIRIPLLFNRETKTIEFICKFLNNLKIFCLNFNIFLLSNTA